MEARKLKRRQEKELKKSQASADIERPPPTPEPVVEPPKVEPPRSKR